MGEKQDVYDKMLNNKCTVSNDFIDVADIRDERGDDVVKSELYGKTFVLNSRTDGRVSGYPTGKLMSRYYTFTVGNNNDAKKVNIEIEENSTLLELLESSVCISPTNNTRETTPYPLAANGGKTRKKNKRKGKLIKKKRKSKRRRHK